MVRRTPRGKTNYGSPAYFQAVAGVLDGSGALADWVSQDFLLMSPGPDGRYGYVRVKKATGSVFLCAADEADANQEYYAPYCDDVFSWN